MRIIGDRYIYDRVRSKSSIISVDYFNRRCLFWSTYGRKVIKSYLHKSSIKKYLK